MKRYIIQSAVVCFLLCALCFTACDAIRHGGDADNSINESTAMGGSLTEDSDSTKDNSSFEGSDSTESGGSFEGSDSTESSGSFEGSDSTESGGSFEDSDSTEDNSGQGGGLELPEDKFE